MITKYNINFVALIILFLFSISWLIGGIWYPDMYGIPSLILIIIFIFYSNDNLKYFLKFLHKNIFLYSKIIFFLILIICFIHLTTSILRYFSFDYATWDVGLHSNILYNFSNGEFYSSFLSSHFGFNVNSLADHFSLSMHPIGWLYLLSPSTLWLVTAKSRSPSSSARSSLVTSAPPSLKAISTSSSSSRILGITDSAFGQSNPILSTFFWISF